MELLLYGHHCNCEFNVLKNLKKMGFQILIKEIYSTLNLNMY